MRRLSAFLALSTLAALVLIPAPVSAQTTAPAHAPIAGITFPISSNGSPVTVQVPATPLSTETRPVAVQGPVGDAGFTCVICGQMSYHGGSVMSTTKLYAIFWGTFPQTYIDTINNYLADIAHDSESNTNIYSVATQYFNATPGAISYSAHFDPLVDSVVDSSTPTGSCGQYSYAPMNVTATTCIFASELEAEIDSVVASHSSQGWASDGNSLYFLFTPQHVGSQFGRPGNPGGGKAYRDYCGYHSVTTGGNIYANQPYAAEHGSGTSFTECESLLNGTQPVRPNSDPADATINVVSHELLESVTDSFFDSGGKFAWTDAHLGTGEIGDKCNFDFGRSPLSSTDSNQTINGHGYWVQEMYSNKGAHCASSLLDANAANISITGTGFATSGVTADIGSLTGINASSSIAGSVKLTHVQPAALSGPSQVNVTVHSGALASTLNSGYSWGPKITSASLSTSVVPVVTITGSGFANNGVTVDLQDSLTHTTSFLGLPVSTSTAGVIKVTAPAFPGTGSSEYDVTVHSGGYTTTLLSLMPRPGQRPFHIGPRIASAKASNHVITVTGSGFATSGLSVDLFQAGTAASGGPADFASQPLVGTPTATTIKVTEPTPPTGPSEYDVVVRSAGFTTTLTGGWSAGAFAFGPHVVSARASAGVITITGSGFPTGISGLQVTLHEPANPANIIPLTLTSSTATVIKAQEPTAPISGSSEYDVDVSLGGLDSYLFSQSPKPGQAGFAFGPHVTASR